MTGLIVLLVLAGIILSLVPMEATIKGVAVKIVVIAAVLIFVVWLLKFFGVSLPGVELP